MSSDTVNESEFLFEEKDQDLDSQGDGGAEVSVLPVLPLRDVVVVPHMIIPLFVGRERSVRALEHLGEHKRRLLLVAQKDPNEDIPSPEHLYGVGALASVLQLLKLPDGTIKLLVEGLERVSVRTSVNEEGGYLEGEFTPVQSTCSNPEEADVLYRSLLVQFESYVKLNRRVSQDLAATIIQTEDRERLIDAILVQINTKMENRQKILEMTDIVERLNFVGRLIEEEMGLIFIEKKIKSRIKRQMEKTQREYYLNEQMKAIQKELGGLDDGHSEFAEIEYNIKKLENKLSKEAHERAVSEFKKLKQMSPMSAEASVVRAYLDWILSLPWKSKKRLKLDLSEAQNILDADHYGLEKIKERIIEYLAVQKRRASKLRAPILCFVGPPGVGKTSLGRSIAASTGRDFIRFSLGGVRDEAEIRGHRRTYIGAMPGKIIQSMRRTPHTNPLFLLDEIDKLGADFRGDPAAALLEVLDQEQNATFVDHYLEIEYDLSNIMFIATANTMDIPPALLDRLEIIRIAGYTEEEKLEICRRHLFQKSLEAHGLKKKEITLQEGVIKDIIRSYTREAGVRSLERHVNALVRKVLKKILTTPSLTHVEVGSDDLKDYLGVGRYSDGDEEKVDRVGIVTGLAWTEFGGELLTIEAIAMHGKGEVKITGNLKDVMKESILAAMSYVRARATTFGVQPPYFDDVNFHIHVPEGATPKDGPSAGVAMATAIVSVANNIPVRKDVAMTGEITLRGYVLPIGGLKEKLLAALRGGIKKVLIPKENARDLYDISDAIKDGLDIVLIEHVDEAFKHALTQMPEPIEWDSKTLFKTSGKAGSSLKDASETKTFLAH